MSSLLLISLFRDRFWDGLATAWTTRGDSPRTVCGQMGVGDAPSQSGNNLGMLCYFWVLGRLRISLWTVLGTAWGQFRDNLGNSLSHKCPQTCPPSVPEFGSSLWLKPGAQAFGAQAFGPLVRFQGHRLTAASIRRGTAIIMSWGLR